jgi:hypothetical protein
MAYIINILLKLRPNKLILATKILEKGVWTSWNLNEQSEISGVSLFQERYLFYFYFFNSPLFETPVKFHNTCTLQPPFSRRTSKHVVYFILFFFNFYCMNDEPHDYFFQPIYAALMFQEHWNKVTSFAEFQAFGRK